MSKSEKREMEISKILQKTGGKLFNVKLEKNYFRDGEGGRSEDFSLEKSYYEAFWNFKGDRPIFKIKFEPRHSCPLHELVKQAELAS